MRRVVLALLCAGLLSQAACYGPFRLTTAVYKFNGSLGNDIVEEIVFLAMIIVPVYALAGVGDALIFNTIEYWTGKALLSGGGVGHAERTVPLPDGSELKLAEEGEGRVKFTHGGVTRTLVRTDRGMALLDEHGVLVAQARRTAEGDVELLAGSGQRLALGDADEVEQAKQAGAAAIVGWAAARHATAVPAP